MQKVWGKNVNFHVWLMINTEHVIHNTTFNQYSYKNINYGGGSCLMFIAPPCNLRHNTSVDVILTSGVCLTMLYSACHF